MKVIEFQKRYYDLSQDIALFDKMPLVPLLPIFHRFNREYFDFALTERDLPILSVRWSDGRLTRTAGFYRHGPKVKGINMIKKHEKTTKEKKGGIITKENFIDISNLRILDTDNKKTKIAEKK